MRLAGLLLAGCALLGGVLAQGDQSQTTSAATSSSANSTSSSVSSTASSNSSSSSSSSSPSVVTTTITSLVAGPTASQTATFVLTLTLDHTGQPNATAINNTIAQNNDTSSINSTAQLWNDTLGYLPFTPHLDAAFGLGGAILLLTGIPVATLGGKNRWSALAIVSGYTLGLFTLVIILSFGVSPALEPPSPHHPTDTMRGLYLLAVAIAFIVGSAMGIFWYTFAKYWVGAAGGFALGWFLVCLRKGGLLTSVGGRWGLIAGLTCVGLFLSLLPKIHDHVLLIASAWVGATMFTLGVDCFTRAGLKEFYIYNLGYPSLFPSLRGQKYPLTQAMQVELGVIAAAALIAGAIQFKVVSILQKRRKDIKAEEEARIEAQQVAVAAENFKNVDAELAEWEGKHGEKSPLAEVPPILNFDHTPSTNTLVNAAGGASPGKREAFPVSLQPREQPREQRRLSLLEEMGYSDNSSPVSPIEDLDLEQKVQLLAQVRRARESIASSLNQLRSTTDSPSLDAISRPGTAHSAHTRSRHGSMESNTLLNRGRHDSTCSAGTRLDERRRSRHLSEGGAEGSERLVDIDNDSIRPRAESAGSQFLSMDDTKRRRRGSLGPRTFSLVDEPSAPSRPLSSASSSNPQTTPAAHTRPASVSDKPEVTEWERRAAEHEEYVRSRTVVAPELRQSADYTRRSEDYAVVSGAVARRISASHPRGPELSPGQEYGTNLARALSSERVVPARRVSGDERRRSVVRAMTSEELDSRHRDAMRRKQDRAAGPMNEEIAVATARDEWNMRTKAEREREQQRASQRERERGDHAPRTSERRRRTEEWRMSLAGGGVGPAPAPVQTSPHAHPQRPGKTRRRSEHAS